MFHTEANVTIHSDSKFMGNTDRVNIFPIPIGPYMGNDYIHMEAAAETRFGSQRVRRIAKDGTIVKDYGVFTTFAAACEAVQSIIVEQMELDCRTVTCNGRYSCD